MTTPAKPVGLLFDSVSNNTGDIAIGQVMQRILRSWDFAPAIVDPFAVNAAKYASLIIGGGDLISSVDDVFYDAFRVPGPHILNTMGIRSNDDLAYLSDYRYVSVRSTADREKIHAVLPDLPVAVAPDVTLLMEPEPCAFDAEGAIGVHVHPAFLRYIDALIPILHALNHDARIVFLPFTHYAGDRAMMESLAASLPGARIAPMLNPGQLFHLIGRLRGVISASLHVAIFAYAQNVPCVAMNSFAKIGYFFQDRQLADWLVEEPADLAGRVDALLNRPPDYSSRLIEDRRVLEAHLGRIRDLLPATARAASAGPAPRVPVSHAKERALRQYIHQQVMESWRTAGVNAAEQIALRHTLGAAERDRVALRAHLETVEGDRAEVRDHLADIERRADEVARYAASLEQDRDEVRASAERDRAMLRTHIESLEGDRASLRAHLEDVEQDRDEVRASAERDRATAQAYIADLERDRAALRAYLESIEQDRANLRTHLESIGRDRTAVREQLATVEQEHAALRAQVETAERERTDVQQHLDYAENARATLHTYLREVERDRATVRARLADAEREQERAAEQAREVEDARRTIIALDAAASEKDRQVERLSREVETLRARLRHIEDSLPSRLYSRLRQIVTPET